MAPASKCASGALVASLLFLHVACEDSTKPERSVADPTGVSLSRLDWSATSVPVAAPGGSAEEQAHRRGEIWWYTPYHAVQEGELDPTLAVEEANDYRMVLEVQCVPYAHTQADTVSGEIWGPEESWVGLVQTFNAPGVNLTQCTTIELWINDFVPYPGTRSGTMYVELGNFSEDALWTRRSVDCATGLIDGLPMDPANGRLDTEDADASGVLEFNEHVDEDTGLNGVLDGLGDPAFDYFFVPVDEIEEGCSGTLFPDLCDCYSQINGTEHNGYLDSEDADGDRELDTQDHYFRFRLDLADTTHVAIDVSRDYRDREVTWPEAFDQGWRLLLIPMAGSDLPLDGTVGSPHWNAVTQIRVWFTGLSGVQPIQIGGITFHLPDT